MSRGVRNHRKSKGVLIMWEKWKQSGLCKKLKQVRVNRAVYLSSVVILLALAVVLAITAAMNRAKKNTKVPPATTPPIEQPTEPQKPTGTNPEPAPETVPEMKLPVSGKLTQKHSVDVQVFSQTMNDFRVHLGIDITTAEDAEVFAAADGTVSKIWEDPMMGTCVALTHSGECVTVYKNLAKELAEGLAEGTQVSQGQLLGKDGDTAMVEIAEEPHLHMEMTVKGLQVNPLDYFSAAVIASLSEDASHEAGAGEQK